MMLGRKSQGAGGHSVETASGIQYVGGTTTSFGGSSTGTVSVSLTSLTGGIDTEPSSGDLVIVFYAIGTSSNRTITISGYTSVTSLYQNDTYDINLAVFYKRFFSTPDTSIVINNQGTSGIGHTVAVQVWRGVANPGPFDVSEQTATSANDVYPDPPSITPVTSGAFVIAGGASAHEEGAATFGSSDLTNFMTDVHDTTYASTIGLGYYEWTSGSFDPSSFSFTGFWNRRYCWAAATLALKPA